MGLFPPGDHIVFHALGHHVDDEDWAGWLTRCGRLAFRYKAEKMETPMETIRSDIAVRIGRPCRQCWPPSRWPYKLDGSPPTYSELW